MKTDKTSLMDGAELANARTMLDKINGTDAAMSDACPKCGVEWSLGRDVSGVVHTPDGLDCLRNQLAQANEKYKQVITACRDAFDPIADEIGLFLGESLTLHAPQKAVEHIKHLNERINQLVSAGIDAAQSKLGTTPTGQALNDLAAECHGLAVERGKYFEGWGVGDGYVDIYDELWEWTHE